MSMAERVENKNEWYNRFKDEDFEMYNKSGEATAVHIVRDIVRSINTREKWVDVVSMSENGYCFDDIRNFDWLIVELFPRLTRPSYKKSIEILPTDDVLTVERKKYLNRQVCEENRYITWKASHSDISVHRAKGHHGERFIVLCRPNRRTKQNDYTVTAVSRITYEQTDYIIEHEESLSEIIRKSKNPTLDILIPSEKNWCR